MVYPDIKRAKRLRQTANYPERKAWETLRQLRKYGYPVRRQHPISGMTVDFAIRKIKLVIEIDGGIHDRLEIKANDVVRDQQLNALGWKVVRVPADIAKSPDHLWAFMQTELGI